MNRFKNRLAGAAKAEKMEGWCDTGRAALRYRMDGTRGPVVVLVHEMGGCIESWDKVVPSLSDFCRVLRFDMRGSGMSEKISRTITANEMADDIADLLRSLEITEPVVIAGCAVGAGVALCYAVRHGSQTRGVVIMNPAIDVTPENKPGLLDRAESLRQHGTRGIVDVSLQLGYPEHYRAADPEHFALFKARWLANDPVSLRYLFLMLSVMDLRPVLPTIACPVLGLSGAHDPLRTTQYVSGVLKSMPNTRLVVIEAGHHMPDQAPDEVGEQLARFIQMLETKKVEEIHS